MFHILVSPMVLFINSVTRKNENLELSLRQMIEIDGCTRCGECIQQCPVFTVTQDQRVTTFNTLQTTKDWSICKSWFRKLFLTRNSMNPERLNDFSKEVYQCTLCGHCEVVCPVNIRSREIRISLRENMVKAGLELPLPGPILENLQKGKNVVYPTNHDRLLCLQNIPGISPEKYLKKRAEVACFIGCVASYYPVTYTIPQAMLYLLEKAEVDFAFLGQEEWCCGWPLIEWDEKKWSMNLHPQYRNSESHGSKNPGLWVSFLLSCVGEFIPPVFIGERASI
jgi:heterodisulfide reductase subunit D